MQPQARLSELLEKRSLIEAQLGSGKDYIELQVRGGQRVRRSDALQHLEYLNREIDKLERQIAARKGPARNRVRLGK